jgi:hypothetical protein
MHDSANQRLQITQQTAAVCHLSVAHTTAQLEQQQICLSLPSTAERVTELYCHPQIIAYKQTQHVIFPQFQ